MNKENNHRIDQSVAGWFLTLRWGTVLCQVLLFAAVHFLFAMTVPVVVLWLIAFEVSSNIVFSWLISQRKYLPNPLLTGGMLLDIILLTVLLALTGGAMNPFTFLYLVHVVVGAILLPGLMAWSLAIFSSACYGTFFWPGLTCFLRSDQPSCHAEGMNPEMNLHLQGMWVAFVITAFFVVFFVTRIQQALVDRRETKAKLREEQLKNERLASLAALSAGAVHEFATPLATIAVAAGELHHEMSQSGNEVWREDLRLIRSQVTRCRDILYQIAADAGEPLGEAVDTLTIKALIDDVRASLDDPCQKRLIVKCDVLKARVVIPRRSLQRILRGLVANAFQASDEMAPVALRIGVNDSMLRFAVSDQGMGMDRETLAQACEPFFTTKPPGQGLGLGLYLAKTLAERLGGGLEIDSSPATGTTVQFWIKAIQVISSEAERSTTAQQLGLRID